MFLALKGYIENKSAFQVKSKDTLSINAEQAHVKNFSVQYRFYSSLIHLT